MPNDCAVTYARQTAIVFSSLCPIRRASTADRPAGVSKYHRSVADARTSGIGNGHSLSPISSVAVVGVVCTSRVRSTACAENAVKSWASCCASPEPTDADKCVHQQLDALRDSLKDIPGLKTFKMEKIDGLNEFCEKQTGTKVTDPQASRNIQFNF